jgi:hypothetical protein
MHFIKATKCFPCGGSQSWLQPAFSRLSPSRDSSVSAGKRCSRQGSPKYALSQPFSAHARRLVHYILAAKITDSLQSAKLGSLPRGARPAVLGEPPGYRIAIKLND